METEVFKRINEIITKHNGYLFTNCVQEAGISRPSIARFVSEYNYKRIEPGIYIPELSEHMNIDQLYILQHKNEGIIYSLLTALFLNGIIEEEPSPVQVSVKRGYNATHLIRRNIKPYYVNHDLYSIGVSEIKTRYGNPVKCYDSNRAICDMIDRKNEMDIRTFKAVIRKFIFSDKIDVYQLMNYARMMRIEKKVEEYLELLL